jgi:glycine/D-amino acid oxidase-like deaminating enzyme
VAAEDFDDGRTDVPGGVAAPVERVLVIGGGIAGLTVANALTHTGIECVVLEARDRIGVFGQRREPCPPNAGSGRESAGRSPAARTRARRYRRAARWVDALYAARRAALA